MPNHVVRYTRGNHAVAHQTRGAVARAGIHLASRAARHVGSAVKKAFRKPKKAKGVKKGRPTGNVGDTHSGLARQTIKIGNRKRAKLLKRQKTVGRWRYTQTNKQIISGASGAQTVTVLVTPLTSAKILTSTGNAYNTDQNDVALEQLNPYLASTGSAYLAPTITPLNDRFIVINCNLEIEITNFSAVGTYVDVYLCVAKKMGVSSGPAQWTSGLNLQNQGQAAQVFPLAGLSVGAPGGVSVFMPGARPSESKVFGDFWQIKAVKALEFTGNSTERLYFDIGVNKVIKMQDIRTYASQGTPMIRGLTYQVFIVQRGAIVVDTTNLATLGTEFATYGSTKLGVITLEKYSMCGVMGATGRLDVSTAYSGISTSVLPVNQALVNEVDVPATVLGSTVV